MSKSGLWKNIRRFWERLASLQLFWDLTGFLLALAGATVLVWEHESAEARGDTFLSRATLAWGEAAVPLVIVLLIRYWYLYHRHDPHLHTVVTVLNKPGLAEGIRSYIGDSIGWTGQRVSDITSASGASLTAQEKFELASYLIHWQSQVRDSDGKYCGTFVGAFATSWDEWSMERKIAIRGQPLASSLMSAFNELRQCKEYHHQRLMTLSKSEFAQLVNPLAPDLKEISKNFGRFLKWHSENNNELVLLVFCCDDDMLDDSFRKMATSSPGVNDTFPVRPGDLVDFGVITSAYVFGTPTNVGSRAAPSARNIVKVFSDPNDVEPYVKLFNCLWVHCQNPSFHAHNLKSQLPDPANAIRTLPLSEDQPWVKIRDILDCQEYFINL